MDEDEGLTLQGNERGKRSLTLALFKAYLAKEIKSLIPIPYIYISPKHGALPSFVFVGFKALRPHQSFQPDLSTISIRFNFAFIASIDLCTALA